MIEKSVWLDCSPAAAFHLFTARISEWWPAGHRPSRNAASVVRLEAGGRFWETTPEGDEYDLGRVVAWSPPEHLRLAFYLGTGPDQPTDVTIRFQAEGNGTRVTVEHGPGGLASLLWDQRAPQYVASWETVLAALVKR